MAEPETWTTSKSQAGWRLDRAVAARPSVGARRRSRTVVESGKVFVDGLPCADPGRAVREGEIVSIEWDRPGTGRAHHRARAAVTGAGVEILFEDAWLVVVTKPPGLLTDSASRKQTRDEESVTDRLDRYLRPQGKRALAAHRIDRGTSGVVLFAKDDATFHALRGQFHARTPERVYIAILDGRPTPDEGTWSDWMLWDTKKLVQLPADADTPGAVLAEAHYRVTARLRGRRTAVEVRLVSGRRNQIRLHAMLRGHPLVGEQKYAKPDAPKRQRGASRHALHALRLAFDHPQSGERVVVESPIPADLSRLLGSR